MSKNLEKYNKIHTTCRIREDILLAMEEACNKTGIARSDIIELSIIDLLLKIKLKYNYEGIDLRNHLKLIKSEKLRNFVKKERNEFLSKNLMMARINTDIHKILLYNKKSKKKFNLCLELIEKYRKEAMHYTNPEDILNQIDSYENQAKKNIDELLHFVENISNAEYEKKLFIDKK